MIGMAYQNMHGVWLFLMSLENEVQMFSDQSVPSMLTLGVVLVKIRGDGVLSKTWESHAERRDVVVIDGITTRGRTTRREVGAGARDPGARAWRTLLRCFLTIWDIFSITSTRNTSLLVFGLVLVPSLKFMLIHSSASVYSVSWSWAWLSPLHYTYS